MGMWLVFTFAFSLYVLFSYLEKKMIFYEHSVYWKEVVQNRNEEEREGRRKQDTKIVVKNSSIKANSPSAIDLGGGKSPECSPLPPSLSLSHTHTDVHLPACPAPHFNVEW